MQLDVLASFPQLFRILVDAAPAEARNTRPAAGGFSLLEHAWHLADLEEEGYGARISLLLGETNPRLPDFRGAVVAQERRYAEQELEPALARFATARAANIALLRTVTEEQWSRTGEQEGVGNVTLAAVTAMMLQHDREHAAEIEALLAQLSA
ncbi:MAG TPA: DinB family protein [Thermoanaerobaculia bacterium]